MSVQPGDVVRIAAGLATVKEVNVRRGGARGIQVIRHHTQNYYLDNGVPREAPARYSEFIQDGFYAKEDQQ